jgi:predicted DNA-binding transcriptional regulator YafY
VPDVRRQAVTRFSGEIREALRTRKKLYIGYRREDGAPSQRRIRPLGLVYWGYAWTLIAWCELRGDYRMFRLDRITELREAGETFATTPECSLRHYLSLVSADC